MYLFLHRTTLWPLRQTRDKCIREESIDFLRDAAQVRKTSEVDLSLRSSLHQAIIKSSAS